ncbi:hypothetical protein WOLCODRAFT_166072 [Wolfiporia cocos MD-104 SS10]|uniref:Inner centromere protein ARK-binding domain-containing protein n=1 Tax=Wolfiporia cocos (strain MD-104) TaxID=742152 RepID=A0A2H3IYX2_WOLCO|nr:hypothetical protein WOLCODRAFT_166072 [Wolfiporia cocos MD-104 SS10]
MDGSRPGESGVLAWCDSIRFEMARDSGRQLLEQQVQSTLDFLDDYLENVLAGPRKETVTDLLKTPGRRKNVPVRGKATVAKGKVLSSLSFEASNSEQENHLPVNSFQKALLRAKEAGGDISSVSIPPITRSGPHSNEMKHVPPVQLPSTEVDNIGAEQEIAEADAIERGLLPPSVPPTTDEERSTPATADVPPSPPHEVMHELSVIAEDDETADLSRTSIARPSLDDAATSKTQTIQEYDDAPSKTRPTDELQQDDTTSTLATATTDTFHTVPLDSPHPPQKLDEPRDIPQTEPIVPTPTLNPKSGLPNLGLTAPSPVSLYKREHSVGTVPSANANVGANAPTGKRSSWLVKAREVRALGGVKRTASTGQLTSTGSGASVPSVVGVKRRSEDISDTPASASDVSAPGSLAVRGREESGERLLKLARPEEAMKEEPRKSENKGKQKAVEEAVTHNETEGQPPQRAVEVSSARSDHEHKRPEPQPISMPSPPRPPPMVLAPALKPAEDFVVPLRADDEDEVLDRLKKTVARMNKSTGKSLGGNAAAALAEARAAAEARVAERNKGDEEEAAVSAEEEVVSAPSVSDPPPKPTPTVKAEVTEPVSAPGTATSRDSERRLSVSDLVSSSEESHHPRTSSPLATQVFKPLPPGFTALPATTTSAADVSSSTTPPNSPPPSLQLPISKPPVLDAPIFTKPPPSFGPPLAPVTTQPGRTNAPAGPGKDYAFKLPTTNPFSLPAAPKLDIPPLPSLPSQNTQLSTQSSKESLFSDVVFNREDDIPAWMPKTQDTDHHLQGGSSQAEGGAQDDLGDDDDSWHVDEKFRSNQMWTPFGFATERDETWSTLPSSTSQKGGDTAFLTSQSNFTTANFTKPLAPPQEEDTIEDRAPESVPGAFNFAAPAPTEAEPEDKPEDDIADVAMDIENFQESESEGVPPNNEPAVNVKKSKGGVERTRSQSQQSTASSSSASQSQGGLLGQASKLVSSVFNGAKKTKLEPVKSLQLAAQAKERQQEEIEKKAQRLKEMENRRQLAQQRKAEDDKARALEEEKRIKDEMERRKREREELTDKRPLKGVFKKGDEDNTKKRKIEPEKKLETNKPPSRDKKPTIPAPRIPPKAGPSTASGSAVKTGGPLKSALKQSGPSLAVKPGPSTDPKASKVAKPTGPPSAVKPAIKGKDGAPTPANDNEPPAPAAAAAAAAAHRRRAEAQLPAESEMIELPDIRSEYSDSGDEDRKGDFERPDWAQSPELRQALQQQSTMNPDDIFGRIGPLRMEEMFRTRQSRFRARTSSANWTGTDQLTMEEEKEYERRMGYRRT